MFFLSLPLNTSDTKIHFYIWNFVGKKMQCVLCGACCDVLFFFFLFTTSQATKQKCFDTREKNNEQKPHTHISHTYTQRVRGKTRIQWRNTRTNTNSWAHIVHWHVQIHAHTRKNNLHNTHSPTRVNTTENCCKLRQVYIFVFRFGSNHMWIKRQCVCLCGYLSCVYA